MIKAVANIHESRIIDLEMLLTAYFLSVKKN
jgi:hypothetical protein